MDSRRHQRPVGVAAAAVAAGAGGRRQTVEWKWARSHKQLQLQRGSKTAVAGTVVVVGAEWELRDS